MGHAVNARVLNGLGFGPHHLALGPRFFPNKPTPRLVTPGIEAQPLQDDTRGRAWDTRYAAGVAALDRLMAVTAAGTTGMTRVPATVPEAPHAWEQTPPEAMVPLQAGARSHVRVSTDGGGAPRWVLIASAPRRPPAQRTVDTHWRQPSAAEAKALQQLCRTAWACEAEAQHALAALTHGLRTPTLPDRRIRSTPRSRRRGRSGPGALPAPVVYQSEGALTSSIAAPEALVAQQRWVILATNALDDRT